MASSEVARLKEKLANLESKIKEAEGNGDPGMAAALEALKKQLEEQIQAQEAKEAAAAVAASLTGQRDNLVSEIGLLEKVAQALEAKISSLSNQIAANDNKIKELTDIFM